MTEMLQKNKNVANNVVNKNSQDLTECWEKGTLEKDRDYYITFFDNFPFIAKFKYHEAMFPYWNFEKNGIEFCNENGYKCVKVLAPVPSYDEWFKIKNLASLSECLQEKNIECLHRENELKEILERHKKATAKAQIRSCDLEIINAQLKELLKDCRLAIYDYPPYDLASDKIRLTNKIDEVLK